MRRPPSLASERREFQAHRHGNETQKNKPIAVGPHYEIDQTKPNYPRGERTFLNCGAHPAPPPEWHSRRERKSDDCAARPPPRIRGEEIRAITKRSQFIQSYQGDFFVQVSNLSNSTNGKACHELRPRSGTAGMECRAVNPRRRSNRPRNFRESICALRSPDQSRLARGQRGSRVFRNPDSRLLRDRSWSRSTDSEAVRCRC